MTVVAQILDRMSGVAKPQRKFFLTLLDLDCHHAHHSRTHQLLEP
jgi:hypothetical protein